MHGRAHIVAFNIPQVFVQEVRAHEIYREEECALITVASKLIIHVHIVRRNDLYGVLLYKRTEYRTHSMSCDRKCIFSGPI